MHGSTPRPRDTHLLIEQHLGLNSVFDFQEVHASVTVVEIWSDDFAW